MERLLEINHIKKLVILIIFLFPYYLFAAAIDKDLEGMDNIIISKEEFKVDVPIKIYLIIPHSQISQYQLIINEQKITQTNTNVDLHEDIVLKEIIFKNPGKNGITLILFDKKNEIVKVQSKQINIIPEKSFIQLINITEIVFIGIGFLISILTTVVNQYVQHRIKKMNITKQYKQYLLYIAEQINEEKSIIDLPTKTKVLFDTEEIIYLHKSVNRQKLIKLGLMIEKWNNSMNTLAPIKQEDKRMILNEFQLFINGIK